MKAHRPRKRFGQHFLNDPGVIADIVQTIAPDSKDTIVEIGPGPGAITVPIAARCRNLHAIELDRDLARALSARFRNDEHVIVHQADALTFDFGSLGTDLRVIGNLPYNVSTPLLFYLLEQRACIRDMHFMLQQEVVARMTAEPGTKAFGRLGIMLGCYFDIEAIFDVEPAAFEPPPAVTSTVVRLLPLPDDEVRIRNPALLSSIVASAFSQRRKTLRNALKNVCSEKDLDDLQIDTALRPENVDIGDWVRLANRLDAQE